MPKGDSMERKVKITMTEEQQLWLLRFLNREWDEEVEYAWNNDQDTSYLKDLLEVYEAVCGKAESYIEAMVIAQDIESKQKQIKELEDEK